MQPGAQLPVPVAQPLVQDHRDASQNQASLLRGRPPGTRSSAGFTGKLYYIAERADLRGLKTRAVGSDDADSTRQYDESISRMRIDQNRPTAGASTKRRRGGRRGSIGKHRRRARCTSLRSAGGKWPGTTRHVQALPKELGVLLVVGGIGGLLLPGPVGSPFLILGGVILWPAAFRRVERCFEKRFPRLHKQGMMQITRFVTDLERRYPWTR